MNARAESWKEGIGMAEVWPAPNGPWVDHGYEDRWQKPVADEAWERRPSGTYVDWVKVLSCPRCTHIMSVTVGPGAYRDAAEASGDHVGEVVAGCNCDKAHAGRPEKRPRGCGYMAWIPMPPEDA
jgi:hypothetical protein